MIRKPIVLDDGKLSQLQFGDTIAGAGNFSFFCVNFPLEIPTCQIMKTLYLEIEAGGSADMLGALEIV